MKKIMTVLFLSCLKATELVEKKLHVKLSLSDRLRLRMHMLMCSACSLYERQSATIEESISSQIKKLSPTDKVEELKKRILQKIHLES